MFSCSVESFCRRAGVEMDLRGFDAQIWRQEGRELGAHVTAEVAEL